MNQTNKVSGWVIIVSALLLGLSALCFAYFQYWSPNLAEAQNWADQREKLKTELDKRPRLEKTMKEALDQQAKLETQWASLIAAKSVAPSLENGGIDISKQGWQLAVDARRYRDSVQNILNRQLLRGGVKVLDPAPFVPMPSDSGTQVAADMFNTPPLPFPVVIYDMGTVRVEGTYEQIMANVRAYKDMPEYYAVVHNLQIQGTAPKLTGSYQLSFIGYVRAKEIHPAVPEGADGGSGGGDAGAGPAGRPGKTRARG
jgi:Tfp pilus assembly protein PilO